METEAQREKVGNAKNDNAAVAYDGMKSIDMKKIITYN